MEAIQAELLNLLVTVATVCIGIVSGYVAKFLRERFSVERLERSKVYAEMAVDFAEQVYKDVNGKEKFNAAKKQLVGSLDKYGIKLSEEEIEMLIESMVAEMNRSFKEEIKK